MTPAALEVVLRVVDSAGRAEEMAAAIPALAAAGVDEIIVNVDWAGDIAAQYATMAAAPRDATSLAGRTILVTGASRGIGAETARLLGARGAAVVVHYGGHREGAEEVAAAIPESLLVQADMSSPGRGARALARGGRVEGPRRRARRQRRDDADDRLRGRRRRVGRGLARGDAGERDRAGEPRPRGGRALPRGGRRHADHALELGRAARLGARRTSARTPPRRRRSRA